MRKICVVTGSRAEYGLLQKVMEEFNNSIDIQLQIIVTGMHLSPEFGLTFKRIEEDGFVIERKLEIILSADTPSAISKSMGLALISFADAYEQLKPDILLILGDRYEIFAAASAAMIARIPIAHIAGGETTKGAFDESIRHSITKMSWWHFVQADEYKRRVIQMGEDPTRVFNVGGLGVDRIKKTKLLSKKKLSEKTKINFFKKNLIITYHPETLENKKSKEQFTSLLNILNEFKDIYLIFTMPNSDTDGRIIGRLINDFVLKNSERSIVFTSLGSLYYLSTLQFVDGIVGNSSSGILEAPYFKIGTINIGDRQTGRLKSKSVIDCSCSVESIRNSLIKLYSNKFKKDIQETKNPYGNGGASKKIINILKKIKITKELKKEFYNIDL